VPLPVREAATAGVAGIFFDAPGDKREPAQGDIPVIRKLRKRTATATVSRQ